jgi:hypothetical protein
MKSRKKLSSVPRPEGPVALLQNVGKIIQLVARAPTAMQNPADVASYAIDCASAGWKAGEQINALRR